MRSCYRLLRLTINLADSHTPLHRHLVPCLACFRIGRQSMVFLGIALITLCVATATVADDPAIMLLKNIATAWEKRQTLLKTAVWRAEGVAVVPRGWCNGMLYDEGEHATRQYPERDFQYHHSLTLWVDYAHRRVRKQVVRALCRNAELHGTADPYLEHAVFVFDGQYTLRHVPQDQNSLRSRAFPEVYVSHGLDMVLTLEDEFAFLAAGILDSPSSKRFGGPINENRYHVVGQAVHAGRPCVVLRTEPGVHSVVYHDIWVDIERDAAIVRMIGYDASRPFWCCEVEYGPMSGTWLPVRYSSRWYNARVYDFQITHVEVNPAIDPECFRLTVKRGVRVQNNVINEVYEALQDGDPLTVRPAATRAFGPRSYAGWASIIVAGLLAVRLAWIAIRNIAVRHRFRGQL